MKLHNPLEERKIAVKEAIRRHGKNTPQYRDFMTGYTNDTKKRNKGNISGTPHGKGHGRRSKVQFNYSAAI